MITKDEQIRTAVAEQAAEWLVANDEQPLAAEDSAALAAWLKASPVHVEEFLGVSVVARDLREAAAHPEYSLAAVLASARAEDETPVLPFWSRVRAPTRDTTSRGWLAAAVTMAAVAAVSLGLLSLWSVKPLAPAPAPLGTVALHFETRHGEQLSQRLADGSVLHLNTDSAVTLRFSNSERVVMLTSGQAAFDVTHEPSRAFRVFAGAAEVVAVGTRFDVRLQDNATVVTVIEGRVVVAPSALPGNRGANPDHAQPSVQVAANQQIRMVADEWPTTPTLVDAQRSTAWLRREIVFDHEPLERVAAEFNRYAPTPIEIATPALRNLEISGVFATDDTEAFVAFLRSLKGVHVDVTATHIRVLQNQ